MRNKDSQRIENYIEDIKNEIFKRCKNNNSIAITNEHLLEIIDNIENEFRNIIVKIN